MASDFTNLPTTPAEMATFLAATQSLASLPTITTVYDGLPHVPIGLPPDPCYYVQTKYCLPTRPRSLNPGLFQRSLEISQIPRYSGLLSAQNGLTAMYAEQLKRFHSIKDSNMRKIC